MDARLILVACAGLAGCAGFPGSLAPEPPAAAVPVQTPGPDTLRPRARGQGDAAGPATASAQLGAAGVTADGLDTTSAEERAAATAAAPDAEPGEVRLGTTVASLGDPLDPGLWLETPLVSAARPGKIVLGETSVLVQLRPSGGAAGSGSRLSLPALRLLGIALTDLPRIEVFGR